jgi:hypothetical protein
MISTFTCQHCGKTLPRNPRLKKKQKYCIAKECQQSRRSARKKQRYKGDPVYRKRHLGSQKVWREQYPAHEYQKEYRASNPEYVKRNREQQGERNKKRQKEQIPMIVNGTSLSPHSFGDGAYVIFKVKNEKIVNGTSFKAQMRVLSGKEGILAPNSV